MRWKPGEVGICTELLRICGWNYMEMSITEVTELKKITKVTKNWIALVVFYKDHICRYSTLYITSVWVLMVFLIFRSSHWEKLYSIGDQHIGKDLCSSLRKVSGSWWRKSKPKKTFSVELFLENITRQCFEIVNSAWCWCLLKINIIALLGEF